MKYNCEACNYETDIISHYTRHLNTKKHANNMVSFICESCGMVFSMKSNLTRHMKKNNCDEKIDMENIYIKYELMKKDLECSEKIKDVYKSQLEVTQTNMTKALSAIKFLTKYYPEAPELKQLTIDDVKMIIDQKNLESRLIKSFENGTIGNFIGKQLLEYIQEEEAENQSLWSTDTTRQTYYTKGAYKWIKDDKGIIVTNMLLLPVFKYLYERLNKYINEYKIQNHDKLTDTTYYYSERNTLALMYDLSTNLSIVNTNNDGKELPLKQDVIDKVLDYLAPYIKLNVDETLEKKNENSNMICEKK